MTKLKPCPFCGSDAKIEMTGTTIENGEEYDDYTVECTNRKCLCFLGVGLFRSKEAAIEAWNRRVDKSRGLRASTIVIDEFHFLEEEE